MNTDILTVDSVRELSAEFAEHIVRTPIIRCPALEQAIGSETEVFAKLEFLQATGTFKARGALSVLMHLSDDQRRAGVTAVSAGNHAIATAFAARAMNTSAKLVMLASANAARRERCLEYGAELILADDVHQAFALAECIEKEEGRFLVHPFEGPHTFRGTGTIGLEICEQVDDFDAVVISIGGGGLCAGMSHVIKQLRPTTLICGVEPAGADSMLRSFKTGEPQALDEVSTIADSLGAPFALPMSFALCRDNVDQLCTLTEDELSAAMRFLFQNMKIAVEAACAASSAALLGPLRDTLKGRRSVLLMCGSNVDWTTFSKHAELA